MGEANTLKVTSKTNLSIDRAIDTPLPRPREVQHVFLNDASRWVEVPRRKGDRYFGEFPREAIIDWHRRRGLL